MEKLRYWLIRLFTFSVYKSVTPTGHDGLCPFPQNVFLANERDRKGSRLKSDISTQLKDNLVKKSTNNNVHGFHL